MADRFLPSSLPAIGHSGTVGASLGSGNHGGNRSRVSIRNRWPHRGHAVLAKGTFLVSLGCSLRRAPSPTLSSLFIIRRTAPQTGRVVDLSVVDFSLGKAPLAGIVFVIWLPPRVPTNCRCSTGEVCVELLLGESPHALPDRHGAQQVLVLVDPAHRDLEPLGDLAGGEVGGRHGRPRSGASKGSPKGNGCGGWWMSWRVWSMRTSTWLRCSRCGVSTEGWPRAWSGSWMP